jgi:hypothetical protein
MIAAQPSLVVQALLSRENPHRELHPELHRLDGSQGG